MSKVLRSDAADQTRDRVLRLTRLTERHDVRIALEAGFDVDEVLWMLDLAEPPPSARIDGEKFGEALSDQATSIALDRHARR